MMRGNFVITRRGADVIDVALRGFREATTGKINFVSPPLDEETRTVRHRGARSFGSSTSCYDADRGLNGALVFERR